MLSDNTNGINTTLQFPFNPPVSNILFPFFGPPGVHNLQLKVENSYATNNTYYLALLVWSKPLLVLQECNVVHYASPNQEITFTIKMTDWNGNCSFRVLQTMINGITTTSEITDSLGITLLKIIAPSSEDIYNISIIYLGNSTLYEFSVKYDYPLLVSQHIPVKLDVYFLEVFPPLNEVTIHLKVQCLNGSMLAGIQIKFIWLSYEVSAQSQQGGSLMLHLPIPSERGNYLLHYEVESGYGLSYSSGFIEVPIQLEDILASQGIGIVGFAFSIMLSLITIAIPVIRHRYFSN
jgi:hypothetical protein